MCDSFPISFHQFDFTRFLSFFCFVYEYVHKYNVSNLIAIKSNLRSSSVDSLSDENKSKTTTKNKAVEYNKQITLSDFYFNANVSLRGSFVHTVSVLVQSKKKHFNLNSLMMLFRIATTVITIAC